MRRFAYFALCPLGLALMAAPAIAASVTWNFDVFTAGDDVFWNSPSAICTAAPRYDASYELTSIQVVVTFIGIDFGPFEVIDEVPPEQLMGADSFEISPPFVIADQHLRYPEPPEAPAFEGDVRIEVDADGFGHASVTDLTLGTLTVDLGFPLGVQTVQLKSVRVLGSVDVTSVLPGDLNLDDNVDLEDLATQLANYGVSSGATEADGDLNADGDVDLEDLATLLANYGESC